MAGESIHKKAPDFSYVRKSVLLDFTFAPGSELQSQNAMPSFKNATIGLAFVATLFSPSVTALPAAQTFSSVVPGQTSLYNSYRGKAPPFPGNIRGATVPTTHCGPAPDDILWQNLLAAEWIVFSFYQQAVEKFDTASFTSLGLPNTTYERITEIRDNEAGHLNAFYTVSRATRPRFND